MKEQANEYTFPSPRFLPQVRLFSVLELYRSAFSFHSSPTVQWRPCRLSMLLG